MARKFLLAVLSLLYLGSSIKVALSHCTYHPNIAKCIWRLAEEGSWMEARSLCKTGGGDLVKIENNETLNVIRSYNRRHYAHWIGLNDRVNEQNFVWTDGTPLGSFQKWCSRGCPGVVDYWGENIVDCVADSGRVWQDVNCNTNLPAICEEIDECAEGLDNCTHTQICTNTNGSFTCDCQEGYILLDGTCVLPVLKWKDTKREIDECAEGLDNCTHSQICKNTNDSFICECREEYTLLNDTCVLGKEEDFPMLSYTYKSYKGIAMTTPLFLLLCLYCYLMVFSKRERDHEGDDGDATSSVTVTTARVVNELEGNEEEREDNEEENNHDAEAEEENEEEKEDNVE